MSTLSTRAKTKDRTARDAGDRKQFEPLEGRQLFSGLQFNLTYDSTVTSLPYASQVESACSYAASQFSNEFSNPMTVNIKVAAGTSGLGGSSSTGNLYTYSQIKSDLLANKATTKQAQADSTLPAADPSGGKQFYVPYGQERALGLLSGTAPNQDGTFTFNSNQPYTFDANNRAVSGKYDFIGVAEHEFSELLGRVSGLTGRASVFDLFRDTASNVRSINGTDHSVYFSIDNGQTNIKGFNNPGGGDLADWASGTNDTFNAFSGSGVENVFTAADATAMEVLGYHPYADDIVLKYNQTPFMTDAYGTRVSSLLGTPITTEQDFGNVAGARDVKYHDNGEIVWSYHGGSHVLYGGIGAEYNALAGQTDAYGNNVQQLLGLPTSDEMNVPGVAGARENTFQGGTIYWSPSTGAHVVYGGIAAKYNAVGGPATYGLPTSDELSTSLVTNGRVNHFQNGDIVWTPTAGAHLVYGAILNEYNSVNSETDAYGNNVKHLLGGPTSDEMNVPGVTGARMNTFQGGAIYWSPTTGAHVVIGGIYSKYVAVGGPAGYGLPTSDELGMANVSHGRVNHFTGGDIIWSPTTGAHLVYGSILGEFNATASETDAYGRNLQAILGAPTSDEMNVAGVTGARMNTFQGGAIYWSPATGAHAVYGAIGNLWYALGGPTSFLGLPTADEHGLSSFRVTSFQFGNIGWTPALGAYVL